MNLNENKKRIIKYILIKIYTGQWKLGNKIPSKRTIAIHFNVSNTLIHNVLNLFKESGLIFSKKNRGYYVVKEDKSSFFLYSLKEFDANLTKTYLLNKINEIPNKIINKIIQLNKNFEKIIKNPKFIKRLYYRKNEKKPYKIAYFILEKNIYDNLHSVFLINRIPLYMFFAKNGFLVTHIERKWFYSKNLYNNNTSWTNLEFISDFEKNPFLINLIYYIDNQNFKILATRVESIFK